MGFQPKIMIYSAITVFIAMVVTRCCCCWASLGIFSVVLLLAWRLKFPWIGHDLKLMLRISQCLKHKDLSMKNLLIDKFEHNVTATPHKVFLEFEDKSYSFETVDQMASRVANVVMALGLKPRDCVAMMMENEPEFVWTFLGLQKIGVAVALINTNLKSSSLVQSLKATAPKLLIVGSGTYMLQAVTGVFSELENLPVFVYGESTTLIPPGLKSFHSLCTEADITRVDKFEREGITLTDICCYIYTSGTTGIPKATLQNHTRSNLYSIFMQCVNLCSSDKVYTTLPLYHSAGCVGFFGCAYSGSTLVLRRKFSASQFWSDVNKHNVTVIQYIGELFRFLLAQPFNELETNHKIRVAFGNGLRKDIWKDVENRFRIKDIVEFFNSTEGVASLLNTSNKAGAIGRLSPFLAIVDPYPKYLVKFDYSSAQPLRSEDGHCIKVGVGEPGLIIAKVPEVYLHNGSYNSYRSTKMANESKLIRGAFKDGDLYFNYGDILVLDDQYFVYFDDRIGDTFRWKGENVSTTEVANAITGLPFMEDANVYGVSIPNHDGRAGMVAITTRNKSPPGYNELKELHEHVCSALPAYARPLFIRHLAEPMVTGTFKQQKFDLVKDGFDLKKIKDNLYFLDRQKETYSPLTADCLDAFLSSKI